MLMLIVEQLQLKLNRTFIWRLKSYYDYMTAKVARANCRGTTCGSSRLRLHKLRVAISQQRALTPQSSVAVTHYILTTTHFTYPEGMET